MPTVPIESQLQARDREATQKELDEKLGLPKLTSDPLGPFALKLAECCSPENGPELNALKILEVLNRYTPTPYPAELKEGDKLVIGKGASAQVVYVNEVEPDGTVWVLCMDGYVRLLQPTANAREDYP